MTALWKWTASWLRSRLSPSGYLNEPATNTFSASPQSYRPTWERRKRLAPQSVSGRSRKRSLVQFTPTSERLWTNSDVLLSRALRLVPLLPFEHSGIENIERGCPESVCPRSVCATYGPL